jgi:DNA-binding XRE family transcriptional regulator
VTGRRASPLFSGPALTRLREERGLSVTELARQMDVSRQTIHFWEKGVNGPSRTAMTRLCKLFGVTPGVFNGD